jgi:spore coat polysaccharide biosynthesis predicted glycosyltransferase SpsG
MPQLMIEADLAISAAGSTIWELAYLGVPAILGVVADNQRVGASALERCGAAMAFDGTSKSSVDELRQALGTVYDDQPRRAAMSEAARGLVDGNGVALVAKQILDTARRRCR